MEWREKERKGGEERKGEEEEGAVGKGEEEEGRGEWSNVSLLVRAMEHARTL